MLNLSTDFSDLPLFASVASRTCSRCFDTRLWLTPENKVELCPRIMRGEVHIGANEESIMLKRSTDLLDEKQIWINPQAFDLARLLTNFDTKNPCPRHEIFETFYDVTPGSYNNLLRKFHALIEELRLIWLLPIGSRKTEPSGYWIITDLDDFKKWIDRVKSAPITQLSTIHKVARHNFPVFARQLELEFLHDLRAENDD